MKCDICGQQNVDGACDEDGHYVCVDCWGNGEAGYQERTAVSFVPADFCLAISYPAEMQRRFVEACNAKGSE